MSDAARENYLIMTGLAISHTLGQLVGLSIDYQEGRLSAEDFAEIAANLIAEASPRIQPP